MTTAIDLRSDTVTRPTEAWKGNAGRVQQYVLGSLGDRRDFWIRHTVR